MKFRPAWFVAMLALTVVSAAQHRDRQTQAEHSQPKPAVHSPPRESLPLLGNIANLLQQATAIDGSNFSGRGLPYIAKLPGGQIYFETTDPDVDDDGNSDGAPPNWEPRPVRSGRIDASHQDQTSYGGKLPQRSGETDCISAFREPYIVLPGDRSLWFRKLGLRLGDGAIIVSGNRKTVAVFADVGPDRNLGEFSVKAMQQLEVDVFEPGFRARRGPSGQPLLGSAGDLLIEPATVTRKRVPGSFIVIVFPRTSAGDRFVSVEAALKQQIDKAFEQLVAGPTR